MSPCFSLDAVNSVYPYLPTLVLAVDVNDNDELINRCHQYGFEDTYLQSL